MGLRRSSVWISRNRDAFPGSKLRQGDCTCIPREHAVSQKPSKGGGPEGPDLEAGLAAARQEAAQLGAAGRAAIRATLSKDFGALLKARPQRGGE